VWADIVDRIKTNHPGATVKAAADKLEVAMGGVTIVVTKKAAWQFDVEVTGRERVQVDSAQDAYYIIIDELNQIWVSGQKPRTSSGRASYSGGGGGGDDDLVVGGSVDLYEPPDDDE